MIEDIIFHEPIIHSMLNPINSHLQNS